LYVSRFNVCHRVVKPEPSWVKAQDFHIIAYKGMLCTQLNAIVPPSDALLCKDVFVAHKNTVTILMNINCQINCACMSYRHHNTFY